MELYSQKMGVGGTFAEGAKRLLGAPDLPVHELLIRESAQNSWDARLKGQQPSFEVKLRKLDDNQSETLESRILTEASRVSHEISSYFEQTDKWVIEISDANTTGLDGVIDASAAAMPGESTNFRDLVFAYGASQEDPNRGGLYGFGKTAAFLASKLSTVVYWSRCMSGGQYEYRLAASYLGDEFSHNGKTYTGRHWWGRLDDSAGVLPIVGQEAEELGESLFARRFGSHETGTSILVLDPKRTSNVDSGEDDSWESFGASLRDAILVNLWPKMTPYPNGDIPMAINAYFDGDEMDFGMHQVGYWEAWARVLNCVRSVELGSKASDAGNPQTWNIAYKRRSEFVSDDSKQLGVLGLLEERILDTDQPFDRLFRDRGRSVCRMRAPELVVDYWQMPVPSDDDKYTCGIFKADGNHETDEAFARAESPAHNSWSSDSFSLSREQKLRVKKAENELGKIVKAFAEGPDQDLNPSSRKFNPVISESMNFLVPVPPPSASEGSQSHRSRTAPRKRISKPELRSVEFDRMTDTGQQSQKVRIEVPQLERPQTISIDLFKAGEDGAWKLTENEYIVKWRLPNSPRNVKIQHELVVETAGFVEAFIEAPATYVLDVRLVNR